MLQGFVAVGIGASLGAWLRWWLGNWFNASTPNLPAGTLIANLVGRLFNRHRRAIFFDAKRLFVRIKFILRDGISWRANDVLDFFCRSGGAVRSR